jgi:cob(I)alamin adenosyltransferase
VHYMNRVSDLLFAMARGANHLAGEADVPWVPGGAAATPAS